MTGGKNIYDDFSKATPIRSYKLVVEGKTLFVNAGWLAELSPTFAILFFGENANLNCAELRESYIDILQLMRSIFSCPNRKPVDDRNVMILLRLAHKYELSSLLDRCEIYIKLSISRFDREQLFQLSTILAVCDSKCEVMHLLIGCLAQLHRIELKGFNYEEMPGKIVADIFHKKLQLRHDRQNRCCTIL